MQNGTFAIHLREELLRRRANNPRYSLRAFALHLGVSSSFLSKILMGKKSVSETTFLKMATRLKLNHEAIESYRARLPGYKPSRLQFNPVTVVHFQIIADWHHYAILEAVTVQGFDSSRGSSVFPEKKRRARSIG